MGFNEGGGFPDNGTAYIAEEQGVVGRPFTMASVDGRTFSLVVFDGAETFVNVVAAAAHENHYLVASTIVVTGITADGRTLSASFNLDGQNDGMGPNVDFQTFFLPPEWVNLTAVTFSGFNSELSPGGFSVDNIQVVREPTTVKISNKKLFVNGSPFTVKGVVYSPTPIGDDPDTMEPYGDYFTSTHSGLYTRDLPFLRQMGANTVRLERWGSQADHRDFLDKAYNDGVNPIYVIAGYWINAGLDIDPGSPANMRSQIKADFRGMVAAHKGHPAILMWSIGSDLNAPGMYEGNLGNLFSLINEMASKPMPRKGIIITPLPFRWPTAIL